jgi:predicted small secreted protein
VRLRQYAARTAGLVAYGLHPPHQSTEKETTMKKITMALAILMSALALSACNTMEGAGKDIERAGEKIQDKADRK